VAAGERPKPPDHVTVIAVLSAAAAVMFLVLFAQTAAEIANPHGRDSINQILMQSGVTAAERPSLLVLYEITWVLFLLIPAVLHGIAFYGLMGVRRAGWVIAFLLACAWSFLLIGIPFAVVLWRRDTRTAFGLT
jgi:amino acid transporter